MRNSYRNLIGILRSVAPFFLIIGGVLGILYTLAVPQGNSILLISSLLGLIAGVSFYTYLEVINSEIFRRRFGLKTEKKSKSKHKKAGKKCPQCGKVIYHRRTQCQHCGFKFPSFKEGDENNSTEPTEDTPE